MPGPAGQELRDRRRRTATLLSKYIKESAQAWDGATSANRLERSANADSTDQSQGSHLLKVYTQTAAQITDNILSVSRMVKLLGFELRFRPTGWEGFTKKDPSTGNYIKIPVFYDADDMLCTRAHASDVITFATSSTAILDLV